MIYNMKKTAKKPIFYDETNIPGGSCMSGKFMTKKEELETAAFIAKYKAEKKTKQTKSLMRKIIS